MFQIFTTLFPRCQAHGYATAEFEVTANRLAVYLPVSARPLPMIWGILLSSLS